MLLSFLIIISLTLLLVFKFRTRLVNKFYVIFGLYIFFIFFLWSLPRLITIEKISNVIKGTWFNYPVIISFFQSQHVPEDNWFHKFIPVILFFAALFIYCVYPTLTIILKSLFSFSSEKTESKPVSILLIWITGAFVVLFLLFKEFMYPYFFTQDDNHAQFFPKILVGLDLIFQGKSPFIDNYQHFGAPLFETGTYAIFDPLMIISYALGRYILQKPYITMEIYVILCMFTGAIFLGYSFRLLKIDSLLSFVATVSFLFSPYFFITIRSWYYASAFVLYLPALLYFFLFAIKKGASWIWFLCVGIVRGLFFYAGNAQYFSYVLIIEFISYLFGEIKLRRGRKLFGSYFCSMILTCGIISPLLISQISVLKQVGKAREPLISHTGISFDAVISAFFPFPISWAEHPKGWGNENDFLMTNMFYIGLLWMIPFFLGIVRYARTNKGDYIPLLIFATVLFFLPSGPVSLIYPIKHFIPLLKNMHDPFKCFPLSIFGVILYSTLQLNSLRKLVAFKKVLGYAGFLSFLVTIIIAVFGTNTAFYTYGEKPYPKLNKGLKQNISKKDILVGFAPFRHDKAPYVTALPHNYSCIYDVRAVNYYDPFLKTKIRSPLMILNTYFSRYGVTKAVVLKINATTDWERYSEILSKFPIIYEDEEIVLYNTNKPQWLFRQIYPLSSESLLKILEYDREKIKAHISSTVKTKWLYHNEYRNGYYIAVDGKRRKLNQHLKGWCFFKLPKGEHIIEIGYIPPLFYKSAFLGLVLILLSIIGYFYFSRSIVVKLEKHETTNC